MRTLRIGDKGEDVALWETFLVGQGNYWVEVDGVFNDDTRQATIDFQRSNNLTGDGTVGPKTYGVALGLGFPGVQDSSTAEDSPNWPPKPDFNPISATERGRLFGTFAYVPAGISANPEAIRITDNWAATNIVQVDVPQLKGITGAPSSGMVPFHRKGADQLKALWQAWEDAGLLPLVGSFAGTWAPRFVRGSRTYLSNHCLPATETVWTTQGPASIADLRGYTGQVWSYHEGHAVPGQVTAFFDNGKKPLLRVRAVGHEITCTPNHPVLVLRKRTLPKPEWVQHPTGRGQQRAVYWTEMVRAENLKVGDRLVATRQIPDVAEGQEVSGDWAEVLGLFLGDGCVHHRDGAPEHVSFAIPVGDRVREHVKTLFTRYFGEEPRSNEYALFYYKRSAWERFLPYDRKARAKVLPPEVWGWKSEAKARLLLGLTYSDGTLSENLSSSGGGTGCRYRFRQGSLALVEGVRMMLASLGFRVSKITRTEAEDRVIKGVPSASGPSWTVSGVDVRGVLNPTADPMYLRRVEAAVRPKQGDTRCWGYEQVGSDFTHHKVTGVDFIGEGDVFDIEVDKHHNFLTGGVVVSNSWATAFDINANLNGLGAVGPLKGENGSVRELVPLAIEHGFYWGGWFNRRDPMHFECYKVIE